MENTINKIFNDRIDNTVHEEFIKFSRGEYPNRYLLESKKQKDKWVVKTSNEFANFLVKWCLPQNEKIKISGIIVCTLDIKGDVKFPIEKVKQFMGIKQLVINTEVNSNDVIELMDKYPRVFFALSFSTAHNTLKIKQKAPKSAKPSTKTEDEPKADFCSLTTTDPQIINDLFFDKKEFKEIKIKHKLKIDSVILPENVSDPVKMRELAKKKGVILREITVDSIKDTKEKAFIA